MNCQHRRLTLDRRPDLAAKSAWIRTRKVETQYAVRLRKIASYIDLLCKQFDPAQWEKNSWIAAALEKYAQALEPWAKSVGERMVAEVAARDKQAWRSVSAQIGRQLHREIEQTPLGDVMRSRLADQVDLITSLPREAAERVHKLTLEGITNGTRANEIATRILETGEVTKSRATLIARTETSRTATELTKARAEYVGSTQFIWRAVMDGDTRPSHRRLNGKVFNWDEPPECDPGHHALPGAIWNCFPGDVTISLGNGVKRIFRSHYTGNVVDIVCDELVSATANHPMLTGRGWVPASEVREGDYLVKPVNEAKLIVDANVDERKTTFEQLFSTFAFAKREASLGIEFNFYGDLPDGKVELIAFDHPLSDDLISKSLKGECNFSFSEADGGVIVIPKVGGKTEVAHSLHSSGCDELESLVLRHSPHTNGVRGRAIADGYAGFFKDSANYGPCDAMVDGDCKFASAHLVSGDNLAFGQNFPIGSGASAAHNLDATSLQFEAENIGIHSNRGSSIAEQRPARYEFLRVSNVSVRNFSGHVYTIETLTGWYGVSQATAIVKNCRCYAEPIIPD